MERIIAPCPSCGALGEVGRNCPFCSSTITQVNRQENQALSQMLIESHRTVSEREFTEKVAHYNVGPFEKPGVAIVCMGDLYGMINKNGDVIIPLLYSEIELYHNRWCILRNYEGGLVYDLLLGHIIYKCNNYKYFDVIDFGGFLLCRSCSDEGAQALDVSNGQVIWRNDNGYMGIHAIKDLNLLVYSSGGKTIIYSNKAEIIAEGCGNIHESIGKFYVYDPWKYSPKKDWLRIEEGNMFSIKDYPIIEDRTSAFLAFYQRECDRIKKAQEGAKEPEKEAEQQAKIAKEKKEMWKYKLIYLLIIFAICGIMLFFALIFDYL